MRLWRANKLKINMQTNLNNLENAYASRRASRKASGAKARPTNRV